MSYTSDQVRVERDAFLLGRDKQDLYVYLTSTGVGRIESEDQDD